MRSTLTIPVAPVGGEDQEAALKEASGPRAMTRVIRLCEILAGHPEGLTLSELSVSLNTPKSTLLNSLRPLVQDDFLLVEGPLYRLGPIAFRLAAQITSAWSLPKIMSGYLRKLAERTGESVGLAIADWTARRAVYVDAIQSSRPVLYALRIGVSGPLYATAAGRVMLAHAPTDWLEDYLQTVRVKALTLRTETDIMVIRRELKQAREQGFWLSVGQLLEETATLAAPVYSAEGRMVAALAIGAPQDRLISGLDALTGYLLETARRASAGLTAAPEPDPSCSRSEEPG